MRMILLAAALVLTAATAEAEPASNPPGGFARDEANLNRLDSEQLKIVRRATRMCEVSDPAIVSQRIRPERNPCVIGSVDNAVATSDDEELQAFHAALPPSVRYDMYRAGYYAQKLGNPN